MPGSESSKRPIYLNTAYSFEERAADLVSRMTPEEKQSLLGNSMAAIPRLGVNAYNVWGEALHGVVGMFNPNAGAATSFPSSASLGSAWDPALMERETSVISEEARGFNSTVISNLTYWSPVVEPVRDPRWGRTGESFGEDPFLISQIGGGFVRGMMGYDPVYLKSVPCGKHYFANNSEFNRHISSSDMDDRDMREFYLAPYRKLIEKDKLPGIMTAYNAVNGVLMSASRYYVDTIARKTFGLNGYVTGDCSAIEDIETGHLYAKTGAEATAMGLKPGVDTDCGSYYQKNAAILRMADIIKDNNTLFLKFEKKGSLYSASCSSDGKNFKTIGTAELMLKDVKAGMIVCNGAPMARSGNFPAMPGMQQPSEPDTPFEVSYDYFRIINKGLK